MRFGRRAAAFIVAAALGSGALEAQSVTLSVSSLLADSAPPAPAITVTGFATHPELGPYTVSLALSLDAQFRNPFYFNALPGETGTFTLDSLMTEHEVVFFRARLSDQFGTVVAEANARHPIRGWVRLVSPLRGPTTIIDSTRKPKFIWTSPPITLIWSYQVFAFETKTGAPAFTSQPITDTTFTPAGDLQANTSYRWEVHARAAGSAGHGEVRVASAGTFVINSDSAPTVTLLYQNFPNPFGQGMRSDRTSIWFDLAHSSKVRLTIYDIRQRMVRRLVPGLLTDATLPAGVYGRDGTVTWDGKDDAGRVVLPGVYVAVFDGDGTRSSIKILFKGP
jgi:hypothetical protein